MGARFNASRRLKRRDIVANASISIFAILGALLTIGQRVYRFQPESALDNYVTALSISLGLFVVVISLMEWNNSGPQRAEMLYHNAEELNALQREIGYFIKFHPDASYHDLDRFRERYEQTKARCPYNHEPIDDLRFQVQHRLSPEFAADQQPKIGLAQAALIVLRNLTSPIWYFAVLWLIASVLVWATPWEALKSPEHGPASQNSSASGQLGK